MAKQKSNPFAAKGLESQKVYKLWVENLYSYAETARQLGITASSVRLHIDKIQNNSKDKNDPLHTAKHRIENLEAELGLERKTRETLLKISKSETKPPEWVLKPTSKVGHLTGIPTLFCSDWHWGEVVNPEEIGKVNEYNLTIAKQRVRNLIGTTVELLTKHIASPNYPGIVLALGGDMVSGDIHEELRETNEIESIPSVLDILPVLYWMTSQLAEAFGKVFIPCVTGNHGRMTHKPRAKRRNHTNFDYLIYKFLAHRFEGDNRVSFMIPEGPDASYALYGHRYLLTHGDQFRGGDGMIGMLGPVTRGDHKKRTRQMQIGQSYDTMLMGHWHQWTPLRRTIVNGSLKGYDEWANSQNFTFEPPQQGLWITHPEHGITFTMPVLVDRSHIKKESTDWVSIPR